MGSGLLVSAFGRRKNSRCHESLWENVGWLGGVSGAVRGGVGTDGLGGHSKQGTAVSHAQLMEQMKRLEYTEPQVMNLLSEARLISDNCVRLWDIAEPDLSRAVCFLSSPRPDYMQSARLLYQQTQKINDKVSDPRRA